MFRLYRKIEPGEFFVVGGDTSQGGEDSNAVQFISQTKIDVPLVFHAKGVAASMTPQLFHALEKLFDITGVQPVVAIERNNGGASEMERLHTINRLNKYSLYVMHKVGATNDQTPTTKYGYDTSTLTRPTIVGDLKNAVDRVGLTIYDAETVRQMRTFVINQSGKPEAAPNQHDDLVMSLGIAWQLFQRCSPPIRIEDHFPVYSQAEELFDENGMY